MMFESLLQNYLMNTLKQVAAERRCDLPLTEKIYHLLLREILSGTIVSGDKLNENRLCKKFKVSRTPVREAISKLEASGLAFYIKNKGSFVKGISQNELTDMLELRKQAEILCVKWAIERITDKEEEELEEIFSYMKFYTEIRDINKIIDINTAFHRVIYNASHDDMLISALKKYQLYVNLAFPVNYFNFEFLEDVLEEHRNIYKSFLNKEIAHAMSSMSLHMDNSIKRRQISL